MTSRITIIFLKINNALKRMPPFLGFSPTPFFVIHACYLAEKEQCCVVCQIACRSHGMVNLQVNSVQ